MRPDLVRARGARAARLGPPPATSGSLEFTSWYSRGRRSRLEIRFSDFDDTDVLRREMSEFQGEFAWELVRRDGRSVGGGSLRGARDGDEAVAHFFRKETYDAAVGKIGGGARAEQRARRDRARDDASRRRTMGARRWRRRPPPPPPRAARRRKARARAGGRAGPPTPGAFGKEKGKEKAETKNAALRSAWDDDEDEEEKDRELGGSSNAFGASGEGTPREDAAFFLRAWS